MQNHAVCLSKLPDMRVYLVGYPDSRLFDQLSSAPNVSLVPITPFFDYPRFLFALFAPLKIFWLVFQLISLFWRLPHLDLILVQNPPSMPTVPICWLLRVFKGKRFVIDWHNLGFSLLEVHKTSPTLVRIAEIFEFSFGRFADGHITVTKALQTKLMEQGIESTVVPDCPSESLGPVSPDTRAKFAALLGLCTSDHWVVTSTSWTPDEDMWLLLEAADRFEHYGVKLTIVITGKGPYRAAFEAEAKNRSFGHVEFRFHFFDSYEDYLVFLGCCDVGVSLHRSSSGLDLPMKGLDMLGAGLPLLSVSYGCIDELVENGENGFLFENGDELALLLAKIFVEEQFTLAKLRNLVIASVKKKWGTIWEESARPVLLLNE
jgi:beta-1,4-mannosyltransferase